MKNHSLPQQQFETVWFSGPSHPLSNLYLWDIFVFGRWYNSAEQAYQYKKAMFHKHTLLAWHILTTGCTRKIMKIAKCYKESPEWKRVRCIYMIEILQVKMENCGPYAAALWNIPGDHPDIRERTKHPHWGGICGSNALGDIHRIMHWKVTRSMF